MEDSDFIFTILIQIIVFVVYFAFSFPLPCVREQLLCVCCVVIDFAFLSQCFVFQDSYRVSFMTELRIIFALMLGSKRKYVDPTKAVQVYCVQ